MRRCFSMKVEMGRGFEICRECSCHKWAENPPWYGIKTVWDGKLIIQPNCLFSLIGTVVLSCNRMGIYPTHPHDWRIHWARASKLFVFSSSAPMSSAPIVFSGFIRLIASPSSMALIGGNAPMSTVLYKLIEFRPSWCIPAVVDQLPVNNVPFLS